MKILPLYDASQDIVCTIDDADRPSRAAMLERMREGATRVLRTGDGLVLHFLREHRKVFADFAVLEKQCCAFFGFAVSDGAMRWEAPPEAAPIVDRIHAFFKGEIARAEDLAL